jgi:hypothetical protein
MHLLRTLAKGRGGGNMLPAARAGKGRGGGGMLPAARTGEGAWGRRSAARRAPRGVGACCPPRALAKGAGAAVCCALRALT